MIPPMVMDKLAQSTWSARSAEYRESWLSSRADTWGEGDAGVNMDPGPVGVEGLG